VQLPTAVSALHQRLSGLRAAQEISIGMNVTVFGATGAIGQLVVADLLKAGHDVTAYVRNRAKVPASWSQEVRVVVGEMNDAATA
jgi:nucleoside-diphosphate-sugar epimerase